MQPVGETTNPKHLIGANPIYQTLTQKGLIKSFNDAMEIFESWIALYPDTKLTTYFTTYNTTINHVIFSECSAELNKLAYKMDFESLDNKWNYIFSGALSQAQSSSIVW